MSDPSVYTLRMSSPPDDVNRLQDFVDSVWAGSPAISATDRLSFETALVELASNVIRHADDGAGVSCTLAIEVSDAQLTAALTDSGAPGNVDLSPRAMPDALSESGRGIALIQALVEELSYSRDGTANRWRIVRQRRS